MELYTIGSLLSKLLGCQVCNTSRAGAGPTLLGPLVLEMVLGRVETQLRNIAGIRGLTIVRGAEMVETSESLGPPAGSVLSEGIPFSVPLKIDLTIEEEEEGL